ncbi:MAG TPA: T9SS type A sorting domain-containing protein [Ignavibacteriaceae bacterium]|nr:T9SS type A sorting domain-containing protein [Ignavibacteriaceae bacterium]
MRKSFQIFFTIVLAFAWMNAIAQEQMHSTGAVPNMKIENIHTIVNTLDNPASIAYAHNSQGNATLSMPIPAGTPFTTLGTFTAPGFAGSMVKGGNGTYYLLEIAPALYEFNTGTGAVTLLGSITGTSGDQPNGITFNPANGQYYIMSGLNFYSFNVGTRVATLIGSMGIAGSLFIDLAFNAAGVCYAYDLVSDAAYTINPATGVATLLGPLGYDANFGQGMSYDMETSTLYLSAFNNGTFTGQLRTMDPGTGATTLITDWGLNQLAPFAVNTTYGAPCPIGAPSNPNPPSGTTGVPLTGNTASWTNGALTVNVELWFGPAGNVVKVYDGPAITSFALPTLVYGTTYQWYVVCKDATCGTQGPTWSFSTLTDPFLGEWCDAFANLSNWTIVGPVGLTNWSAFNSSSAGGTAPELRMSWTPSFNGLSVIRSVTIPLLNNTLTNYSFNYFFDWFADPSGTIIVGITYDGGTTVTPLYSQVDATGNVGPQLISGSFTTPASGAANAQLIVSFNGNSFNNDNIFWDNMCLDWIVPVELTAFTAIADFGVVELQWITATETNNQGFEVQRSAGSEFETIAFVEGHGTTTETQVYTYSDKSVNVGSYTYRLKQIDFDGTSTYSNLVEVDVPAPAVFTLDQNYPNPFNPSTKIAFRLAVDSKVSLKVFDVLGQEVASLVNSNLAVGAHSVDFDASSLNSGVYLYRIEATGIDGTNFVDVKKMILTK